MDFCDLVLSSTQSVDYKGKSYKFKLLRFMRMRIRNEDSRIRQDHESQSKYINLILNFRATKLQPITIATIQYKI